MYIYEYINEYRSSILAACLHPAAAFTFGTEAFIEYEDANIGITKDTWNKSNTFNITFQDVLNMMFIDAIWMGVLAWYIANTIPSEFGTHQVPYFFILPSYWLPSYFRPKRKVYTRGNSDNLTKVMQDEVM